MNHCWHKPRLAGSGFVMSYDAEVCCFCGAEWSEHHKVPRGGHGTFDPEPVTKPKPSSPCEGRMNAAQEKPAKVAHGFPEAWRVC